MPTPTTGMTEKEIARILRRNVCAECSDILRLSRDGIVCDRHPQHQGIANPYEPRELTIEARREQMVTEHGEQKTTALAKYEGVISLRKDEAREIIDTIWPSAVAASPTEVYKAVSICVQYGLNPLMKHVYLIPFYNKERRGFDYVTVLGIGATRLIASRKHSYSYLDDSPRLMTVEEQERTFGEVMESKLVAVTILKDMKTGATARGYGFWPKFKVDDKGNQLTNEPKGTDKGNSKANMAFIRSERQALDRLYPADMPKNVEIVDEQYEATATVEPPTQIAPGDAPVESIKDVAVEPPAEAVKEPAESQTTSPAPEPTPAKADMKETKPKLDEDWLTETMRIIKWSDTTVKSWIKSQPKWGLNTDAPLTTVLNSMSKEQIEKLTAKLLDLRAAAMQ